MRIIITGIALAIAGSAAFAQDAPKRLTADDLAVETHKWDGKIIQVNAQCFFADTDEYRCAVLGPKGLAGAGGIVRVDFAAISPPEMKKAVEDNCDTLDKMMTKPCRFQIVFTYSANERKEGNNGLVTMSIVAQDFAGTFSRGR